MMATTDANVNAAFNNFREYYSTAFAAELRGIWQGVPAISNSATELDSMAYYRALTAYYDNDDASRNGRRKLLYAYLANDYDTKDPNSTLNRRKQTLPVRSSIRKVIRNIATAYNEEPARRFEDEAGTLTETMRGIYRSMRAASTFKNIYHRARLCGVVAVRPIYVNGAWYVDVMTPDEFRITSNPEHWREVAAIHYPLRTVDPRTNESTINYVTWTANERIERGYDGRQVRADENRYGVIPWSFLRLDGDASTFFSGGMVDMLEAQLEVNKYRFIASLNATFNGSPVWIGRNLGGGKISLSPDQIVTFTDVKVGEGLPIPPELESIAPSGTYAELDAFASERLRGALSDEGLPASMTSGDASVLPSGIARVVERQEIIEQRIADLTALREFEADFARLVAITARVDAGISLDENALSVSVDYAEERVIIEPEKEYAMDRAKVADGMMTVAAFYAKWSGDDSADDEAAIVDEIAARREQATAAGFALQTQETQGVDA